MSNAQELIARLAKGRQFVVDLGDGLSITCLRPTETEVMKMTKPRDEDPETFTIAVENEHVAKAAIGWEGFTEAALFGESVGSSDPIEFDPKLWAALEADHVDWYFKVAGKMIDAIAEHNKKRNEAAKNSAAASTPTAE